MDNTKDTARFLQFRNHPFVESIAATRKWTTSTKDKMPVDMYTYEFHEHQVHGALFTDERSLVSLDKLHELMPDAQNYAFYLDALEDRFVVLDIEPSCPPDVKQKLLRTPYIYGETSMSGKGLHLVFPLPEVINSYPDAKQKTKMLHEKKYYEILLCHYVTFTGRQIPASPGDVSFELLFEHMCREQKPSSAAKLSDFDPTSAKPQDIPFEKKILGVIAASCYYSKTVDDFNGDLSRFEYGFIGKYYCAIKSVIKSGLPRGHNAEYTDDDVAWLLYLAVQKKIPHRDKHDTMRSGMPFLLWRCYTYVIQHKEKED